MKGLCGHSHQSLAPNKQVHRWSSPSFSYVNNIQDGYGNRRN